MLSCFTWEHHFRTAFLLSIMAFLRISNLVPSAIRFADPSKLHKVEKHRGKDLLMKRGNSVLTESHLRKTLTMVLRILGINHTTQTYHCFRRSGEALAFNENVNFESIKAQGGWQSVSIWSYLFNHSQDISILPKMFQELDHKLRLGQKV